MAETLGAAVLTVSVDDTQLRAGLLAVQTEAQRTAAIVRQAFEQAAQAQRQPPMSPRRPDAAPWIKPPPPPPIPPELLQRVEATGAASTKAAVGVRSLVQALAGLGIGAAVAGFLRSSVTAAAELETITRKLSNTLGAQGAAGALAFTRGLSEQLGLNFKTLAGSFGSFTAAATSANIPIETQKNLFAAVAKAGQALGLSNDEVSGSLLALQQVASKGTVQMEELRGQLGERLPIALSATARGLGLSQKQLISLVESGKLTADRFFPALTKGLNELTTGAGGVPTAAQNFEKLGNAWDALQTSFGESLLPTVIDQVNTLAKALEGVTVRIEGAAIGLGQGQSPWLNRQQADFAIGQLRGLAKAYNLTRQESLKLFEQSAKLQGVNFTGPLGFTGTQKDLDAVIDRLPELAQRFRQLNPDTQAAKRAQEAREAADAQKALQEAEARQARNRLDTANTLRSLEIEGINNRADAARQLAALEGVELVQLQNKLAIQDKILERRKLEVQLQDELSKPVGSGDGKSGTQSTARIEELQGQILKVNAETRQTYQQAGQELVKAQKQADVMAMRRLEKDIKFLNAMAAKRDEIAVIQTGINTRIDVTDATSAAAEGRRQAAAASFDILRPVMDAKAEFARLSRDAVSARQIADISKTEEAKDNAKDAAQAAVLAAADLAVAGERAGEGLRNGATDAAKQLRDARSNFNDVVRGGFENFTRPFQEAQIALARQ
ncbi:MAG: tape measure protein, partial [Cyanobacteriota bacterium]|nr:tape measure protein [Cyanobacteriota bacterium]